MIVIRLLGHKFPNKHINENIKNWSIKIFEDEK